MPLPLDGIVVADFSRVLAGPLVASTLADLGARVIKVERPEIGDDTRAWGPPWTANGASYFHSANRTKESVALDFGDPDDLALAQTLASRADVVVENFRAGTLDRFGLSYDQVRSNNPAVIYCSITGFGGSGKGAQLPGYDVLVQAVGGLMSITGAPDADPMKAGVALVDVLTSKDAATGILAALLAREKTGQGQRVEVDLLSSLLAALVNQASSFLTTGSSPARMGNAHPSIAPYELLRCADGNLVIACGNDAQFRRLASGLGDASIADDARFATNAARVTHRDELVTTLESLLSSGTVDAWVTTLVDLGIPAGKVGTIGDAFALATDLGLDPLVTVGEHVPAQVRSPITLSHTPITNYAAPPQLDQHGDSIRRWLQEEEQ